MSMVKHFADLLEEDVRDPFEAAADSAVIMLSEEQKEAARRSWNNRIMNHCVGIDPMVTRMLARRARRAQRRR